MPARDGPPFELLGIDHLLLLVDGLPAAERFYCEVIGCSVQERLPEYGMVQLSAGTSLIDLVDVGSSEGAWARPGNAGGRNMDHFCLATGPWEEQALRHHLSSHHVEIIEEGVHSGARGASFSLYVRDPSGNVVELKGPS